MASSNLSKQQQIFLDEYIRTCNGIEALKKAYPTSKNWTYNAQHVQVNKLLNNPKIDLKLAEHNRKVESTLAESTTLNKRRILNEIIELQQTCKQSGAGQSSVNLQALKLLSQIAGMLSEAPQVQVNIQNTQVTQRIDDYLGI